MSCSRLLLSLYYFKVILVHHVTGIFAFLDMSQESHPDINPHLELQNISKSLKEAPAQACDRSYLRFQ